MAWLDLLILKKLLKSLDMKSLFISILVVFSCISCQTSHENLEEETALPVEDVSDGIFIHITEGYDDAHRVLMPLKMAYLMADEKDVLVYLDIQAVELVMNDSEDMEYKNFESLKFYLQGLLDKGVGIYACPTCMEAAGYEPEDLMVGVQTAHKDAFFNFTKGRIITLDY